jgi:hypothetical protein
LKSAWESAYVPVTSLGFNDRPLEDRVAATAANGQPIEALASAIKSIAGPGWAAAAAMLRYGARYRHLVGHSGGGLWARRIIQEQARTQTDRNAYLMFFRALSLTTINTPHFGTLNADYRIMADPKRRPAGTTIDQTMQEAFMSRDILWSELMYDLQVQQARAFSTASDHPAEATLDGRTHTIEFGAIWSDANVNDSCQSNASDPALVSPPPTVSPCSRSTPPSITSRYFSGTPDEAVGYESPDPDVFGYQTALDAIVAQNLYQRLFLNDPLAVVRVPSAVTLTGIVYVNRIQFPPGNPPNANFQFNDLNVTKSSALPQGLPSVQVAALRANHTTVGKRSTGDLIRNVVRYVESSR